MWLGLVPDASGRKIGKSEGNAINIDAEPEDLFGKVMTLPDEVIWVCFESCTNVPMERITLMRSDLGSDPRRAKEELAWEIVRIYHSTEAADRARAHFTSVFAQKEIPDEMPEFRLKDGMTYVDVLVATGICASNSDARRQVAQKAIKLDGQLVHNAEVPARAGVLQKGKRHFVRLIS